MTAEPKKTVSEEERKKRSTREKVIAIVVLAAVVALIIFLIVRVFGDKVRIIVDMLRRGDEEEIAAYLNSQGTWRGLLMIFFMSVLQVISIFIPGIVIQIAAGACYGWLEAFIMTFSGFLFGNVLVFYVARRLSRYVADILNVDKKNNWLLAKVNHYSPFFVLLLAYMIPGMPNGSIPYFASRLDIRAKSFAGAVAAGSFTQILLSCIAGHTLIRGNYVQTVISIGIQIVIILIVTINRDYFLNLSNRLTRKK